MAYFFYFLLIYFVFFHLILNLLTAASKREYGSDTDLHAGLDFITVGFLTGVPAGPFGHGLVVISISLIIGSGMVHSHIPEWLNNFGHINRLII